MSSSDKQRLREEERGLRFGREIAEPPDQAEKEARPAQTVTSRTTRLGRHPYLYAGVAAAAMLVMTISFVNKSPESQQVALTALDAARPPSTSPPQSQSTTIPSAPAPGAATAPAKKPSGQAVMVAAKRDFPLEAAGPLAAAGVDAKSVNLPTVAGSYPSMRPTGLYQAGKRILRIQVALTIGNRKWALAQLEELDAIQEASPLATLDGKLRAVLQSDDPPPELIREFAAALESFMGEGTNLVSLGVWAEAVRMGAEQHRRSVFRGPEFIAETLRLQQSRLPKDAADLVASIAKAATPTMSKESFEKISIMIEELDVLFRP